MTGFCLNCNRELNDFDRFCDSCGAPRGASPGSANQSLQNTEVSDLPPTSQTVATSTGIGQGAAGSKTTKVTVAVQSERVKLPPYTVKLLTWSFAIGVIPPVALIAAVWTKSLYLLDYVHVMGGGTWTGFDIFMGVVMTRIMRSLDIPHRVEIAKRLTPTTFFILPSLAATAITAGIYLAEWEGKFDLSSPWIIASGVVVLVLTAQGFGVFMPNGVRIFIELGKNNPDTSKIARLNMQNIRLSASQAIFQVIIIIIMAHLAIY